MVLIVVRKGQRKTTSRNETFDRVWQEACSRYKKLVFVINILKIERIASSTKTMPRTLKTLQMLRFLKLSKKF